MANREHLEVLNQGLVRWNQWRADNPSVEPNLIGVNLPDAELTEINFKRADLSGADLTHANLNGSNLTGADLRGADLSGANLLRASLYNVYFRYATLVGSNLRRASLDSSDFYGANLTGANLSETHLSQVHFSGALLSDADFTRARCWETVFGNNDLRSVKGLDSVKHNAPSTVGVDTLYRSAGEIPEVFLRGAGVPENLITYMASLTGSAMEFYSCFISYSSNDHRFVDRLHTDLQSSGVRCWFAPEDLKIGDRIRTRIDDSIRLHDKLLLVLSRASVASQWVEQEVETALSKEREQGRTVLFPIRLDDSIMKISGGWPSLIKNSRYVGDFTKWKDYDSYKKAFSRLLIDLQPEKTETSAADPTR